MATVQGGQKSKRSAMKKVPFNVNAAAAKEVILTGDFTGWKEDGIRLSKGQGGDWQTTLDLPPGEYEYRLRIDGEWRDHAEAAKRVPNPFGGENDVLTVA